MDIRMKVYVLVCLHLCGYLWIGSHLKGKTEVKKLSRLNKEYIRVGRLFTNNQIFEDRKPFITKAYSNELEVERKQSHLEKHEVDDGIVTMFTTTRDRDRRRAIHNRPTNNWAAPAPAPHPAPPVPSTERNSSWIDRASANNWTVRILYALRHNLPIVKAMFKDVLAVSSTPFVGYANADMLFDRSLIETLRYLNERLDVVNQMILVVGRRRNVDVGKFDLGSGSNLTMIEQMDSVKLFHSQAQDYFIVSRRGLPWEQIPDFVVGRNGYDNWLVAKALQWKITLIDTSRTVLALHQCGEDGYRSGSRTVNKTSKNWNKQLVKGFDYTRGSTYLAPLFTNGRCSSSSHLRSPFYCNQMYDITLRRRMPKGHSNRKKNIAKTTRIFSSNVTQNTRAIL